MSKGVVRYERSSSISKINVKSDHLTIVNDELVKKIDNKLKEN